MLIQHHLHFLLFVPLSTNVNTWRNNYFSFQRRTKKALIAEKITVKSLVPLYSSPLVTVIAIALFIRRISRLRRKLRFSLQLQARIKFRFLTKLCHVLEFHGAWPVL